MIKVLVDCLLNLPPVVFIEPIVCNFFQGTVRRALYGPVRKEARGWAIVADFAQGKVKEIIINRNLKASRGVSFRKVEVKLCMIGLAITEGRKAAAIGGLMYLSPC